MVFSVNESNFSQEVLESSTPVLINFWAPWCGLCRMVNPLLNKLQTEWGSQVKLVSINADDNLKLASTYRLTSLPTLLLVEGGNVLHRFEQFSHPRDLQSAVESFQFAMETIRSDYSYTR